MTRLILGSGSPRRRELLAVLGIEADEIRAPDVDETPLKSELPRDYCNRVTRLKSSAISIDNGEIALCADTTVAVGRRILGKAADEDEARKFLKLLSGRRHQVITSIAVKNIERIWQRDVISQVRMKRLSEQELDAYIATGDWQGKAGAYGIQGPAGAFVPWISGSYTAIMGLPVAETAQLLRTAGVPVMEGS